MARVSKAPEERKQEIIEASFALFREKGYEQTTVRDIVTTLGVAQGLFYYYFKSKEDVFFAGAQQSGDLLIDQIAGIIGDRQVSPMERVRTALSVITGFFYDGEFALRQKPMALSPRMRDYFNQRTRRMLEPYLADLLTQGQEAGEFSVDHALYTTRFLLSGFLSLILEDGAPTPEEFMALVEALIERLLLLPQGALAVVERSNA